MHRTSQMFQLTSRPTGKPSDRNFRVVSKELRLPPSNAALVENIYYSVDPYMREMMDGGWELEAPLEGLPIGRVLESTEPGLSPGDVVLHHQGWRTHAVVTAAEVRRISAPAGVPLTAFLGILGGTGVTAYVALTKIARLQAGETLFISAAAGAVGSAAGQIARLLGARKIIGSAGSPTKVDYLTNKLRFDAAINYRDGDLRQRLRDAASEGLHVYVDNVGGDHLEAAIDALSEFGRIAWVGAIAQYTGIEPRAAPRNLFEIVNKSIRLEGFLVKHYFPDVRPEFEAFIIPQIQTGAVTIEETITRGFHRSTEAFFSMLDGGNIGKMLVQVAEE